MTPAHRRFGPLFVLCAALTLTAQRADAQDLELMSFGEAPAPMRDDLRGALYEEVEVLGTTIHSPRRTDDARRRLEALAAKRPAEASFQRYLAKTLDRLGEHKAATAAYQRAELTAPGETWPLEDAALFHSSRGNWTGELGALKRLAAKHESRIKVPGERHALAKVLVKVAEAIESHQVEEDPLPYRRQAAELFPDRFGAGEDLIRWLVKRGRLNEAVEQFAWARRIWPEEHGSLASYEMELLFQLERNGQVREVLLREIELDDGAEIPWVWGSYVERLRQRGELESELRRVRTLLRGGPLSGIELAEAVHLLRVAGHRDEARRAVEQAAENTEAVTDEDLLILSTLFMHLDDRPRAARLLYAIAATNRGTTRDVAQARLALLLAERRGSARASGLQALLDPAHLDSGPSVTGGLLSLLWGGPPSKRVRAELRSSDERHLQAVRSALLVEDLRRRRSGWDELARVELRLISAYRSYGAKRAALQSSLRFLKQHPEHPQYFRVGIETAHLQESMGQSGIPLLGGLVRKAVDRGDDRRHREVLREIQNILSADRRYEDVVSTYWTSIEVRPEDPGLYQDLLRFLDRHNLHAEQQRVYRSALDQFSNNDWATRYARWVLRRRGNAASRELTRRLVRELAPGEVARFLGSALSPGQRGTTDHTFYLEVHRAALEHHPGDLEIVRQLLAFYNRYRETYEDERLALLLKYAPYDDGMRDALYATLTRSGRLGEALEQLEGHDSTAARSLAVDFHIRRAEHRRARTVLAALVNDLPSHRGLALRLVALEESLGDAERAREVMSDLLTHWPADATLLTRAGELAINSDDLTGARQYWGRIYEARPGDPEAYRNVATILWDYYLFEDAARTLISAREALGNQNIFAFELAAVHESAGNREPAIREYLRVLSDSARRFSVWPPYDMRPRPPSSSRRSNSSDNLDNFDDVAETDDALIHVQRRLVLLAKREGDREMVEAVQRDMISQDPEDQGMLHIRIDLLQATGRWDEAYTLLADSALHHNSHSIQERAIRELSAAGREAQTVAVLRRLAQNRPEDLSPTFRLADYLERHGTVADAATALRTLAERLSADESRRRDQLTVTTRLARLLYAHGSFDEAIATGHQALGLTQGTRGRSVRIEIARWLLRLERHREAVELVRPVLAEDPSASNALDVLATGLVTLGRAGGQPRQEVVTELIATFDSAVETTRARSVDSEYVRERVREMRLTLARHLLELDAHRAVLQQHIVLINEDLENETLLVRAYRHAAAHDLVDVLERRYQTDAERSPRDHRLPLVLARLAAAQGEMVAAAGHMESSLAIAPERTDLREEMIGYLLRQLDWTRERGGWREAALQYRRLAELVRDRGGTGARYTTEEARMHGRVGDWESMNDAVERLVANADTTDPQRHLAAAGLYAQAARWNESWNQTRAYLDFWREADEARLAHMRHTSPDFSQVANLAARSGHWRETCEALTALETAWRAFARQPEVSDRYMMQRLAASARTSRFRDMANSLRIYGVDRDVAGFVDYLRREIAESELSVTDNSALVVGVMEVAEFATHAGAPQGQLDLLEELQGRAAGDARNRVALRRLAVYDRMGAMRDVQRLIEAGAATMPESRRLEFLLDVARFQGDREAEDRLLQQVISEAPEPSFDHLDPRLERLLDIRWQGDESSRSSIVTLAVRESNRSGQIINYLLLRGDHQGARNALESYVGGEQSLWLDTATARIQLHRAKAGPAPDEHEPFVRALDLRKIGEQADRPANKRRALTGKGWASLAQPYGEALARSEVGHLPGARMLEHAGIELNPRSAQAHMRLARRALERSEPSLAVQHYQFAHRLSPRSLSIIDGLARALIADQREAEALAMWDGVLATCRGERCVSGVLRSMNRAGRTEAGVERVVTYLRQNWRSGSLSLHLLEEIAEIHGARGRDRGGPVDRVVWDLWRMDRGRLDLLAAASGRDRSPLLVGRARGRYIRQGLQQAGSSMYERQLWVQLYAEYLSTYDLHRELVELIDTYFAERSADSYWSPPLPLRLGLARGLIGLGRNERALEELREIAETNDTRAVGLLRELDLESEAWELQLEVARSRLDRGRSDRIVYLAAIEALLELDRASEAVELVREASMRRADDPATLRGLADLLSEHEQAAEAYRLRRILYRMERSDYANLLALARLDMELGRVSAARRGAMSLLARWAVPAAVEEGAADLLVEIVTNHRRQRTNVITELMESLDGRTLDEDRALALARVMSAARHRRQGLAMLERSIREAVAPWRSLQLLAAWEVDSEWYEGAARHLEAALIHSNGSMAVRRQLFLVRRRSGQHEAALVAIGVSSDRPSGTRMLEGLEQAEAIALCAEIADSAARLRWWAAADAYASAGLGRIDEEEDPERARHERARVQAIRTHLDERRATSRGRPWIRRGR